MARTADQAVRVEGLATLRKNLRSADKDSLKEVQRVIKSAAEIVAADARTLAPRKTGRLAGSIKAGSSGNKGVVRSNLPYANVQHWGGTTGRGHGRGRPGSVTVRETRFITRAVDRQQDAIERELVRGFNDLARRNGFT